MFDLATKYCFYLDNNPKKSMRLFLLLFKIENYVNGAIIQMNRLERHRRNIKKIFSNTGKDKAIQLNKFRTTYLACDTHYYFICIDKIYKLQEKLYKELQDQNIKKLRTEINKIFNISTVRNHLEHIENRCVGYYSLKDKKAKKQKQINDFGNFIGDDFSFDNKKYPSGKNSLKELKRTYRELIRTLHDSYALKNPQFVKRQEIESEHERVMKNLKKIELLK